MLRTAKNYSKNERKAKMKAKTKIMFLAGLLAVLMWNGYVLAEPQGVQGGPPFNFPGPGVPGGPGMRPFPGGPGMERGPGGPDGVMGIIMSKLDLTDEQPDKIETIMDASCSKTRAAQRAVEKAHRELEKAVAGDANEPAIRKAATSLGNAIGDEAVLKVKTMKEVKAVLTPEQLKKLEEIKVKMKAAGPHPLRQGQGGQRPGPMPPPDSE
jgi:Spy/CpxP family protein refolding chaperone